jgi:hypothetical protein
LWTRVDLTFTHILTSNTYLLLRRIGVSGLDEDRLIDHFVHLPGPQHICYNVAVEQAAVHNKIKARETQGTDDNNIEVVKVNGIKIEPIDKPAQSPIADADVVEVMDRPPPHMKHPSLSIVIGGASTAAANPICLDDDITPSSTTSSASALFSAFPSSSPSTTPPASPFVWPSNLNVPQSLSTTSSMLATSGALLKWPAGMYTVNMAQGFLRLEAVDMQHIPLAECFQQVFKTSSEFKQQTYTDTRLQWTQGLESLRTEALDVGRTKAGLESLCCTGATEEVIHTILSYQSIRSSSILDILSSLLICSTFFILCIVKIHLYLLSITVLYIVCTRRSPLCTNFAMTILFHKQIISSRKKLYLTDSISRHIE